MPKRKSALFLITFITALHLLCADCLYASEAFSAEASEPAPSSRAVSDPDAGAAADDAWYLDPDRKCSLTVHAYVNQNGTESSGRWSEDQEMPDGAFPLAGVVYSYWKIGDIAQLVIDQTAGIYICHVDTDLLNLLSDNSGGDIERIMESGEACYSIEALQTALDRMPCEDALTDLAAEKGTAMQPTDSAGTSRTEGLPQSLYLLAETGLPTDDNIAFFSGAAPSFVMLPQMDVTKFTEDGQLNNTDSLWLYDVFVYPKNRSLSSGKKIILADRESACADADDRECGSSVTFVSCLNLPVPGGDSGYDLISMTDTMTEGLAFTGLAGIFYGPWLPEEDLAQAGQLCRGGLLPDTDYIVTEENNGFFVELTSEGLNKVNSLVENGGIYIFYNALVTRDASIGTAGVNLNESSWAISTDRTSRSFTPAPAGAAVALYGIDLQKKGLSVPSEARFEVRRGRQLLNFHPLSDGRYILAAEAAAGSVSALSPGPDGHLLILGLDQDTYTFCETKTEQGRSLLVSPFDVTLTASPVMNGALEKAELLIEGSEPVSLSLSADNAGIAEFSVSNEGVITPLKAGDDGYWKVAVFVAVFGTLLLIALLVRRRGMSSESDSTTTKQ